MKKLGSLEIKLNNAETGKVQKFELILTPQAMMDILCEYSIPVMQQNSIECDLMMLANIAEVMCEDDGVKMAVFATPPEQTIKILLEVITFVVAGGKHEKKPKATKAGND